MSQTLLQIARMIIDGEDVNAGVTNRPIRDLDANIRRLRDLFDAISQGQTVIARRQVVESAAEEGMPVFYNGETQQFERALSETTVDSTTGAFRISVTAQVWGIVLTKYSATSADVLLHGMEEVDLSSAVDGDVESGLYYLSSQTPGKLVQQRPPVGVAVLQVAGTNAEGKSTVLVSTTFRDILEAHRHYKFTLQTTPAGDTEPPAEGDAHVLTNGDTDVEGWLPADDASFSGRAPAGAKFGYNLNVSGLKNLWPPQPVEGCDLVLYPGGDGSELGGSVPQGTDGMVVLNRYGIWWMTDCYGRVPWDVSYSSSSSESASEGGDCPLELERKLVLWFTRPAFANNATWVSSLQAREGSGLLVTCVDNGEAATTGHLIVDLDLELSIATQTQTGHIALKGLSNNRFVAGPVVESLKSGSSNVTIGSNVAAGTNGELYGELTVSVDLDLEAGEIGIDISRLDGVEEEYFADVISLGFRANRDSSIRGRLTIPTNITLPEGTKIKLVFWMLDRSSSSIPADIFSLSYRRIPVATSTPQSLPLDDDEVVLPSVPAADVTVSVANQYVLIESEPFEILSGEQVLFELARNGEDDEFSGDLFLMRQYGKYVLP